MTVQAFFYPENPLSKFTIPPVSQNFPNGADAASARAQIKMAEEEIHKLDAELALIIARREQVMSHRDRCREAIAPYKKLPPELIRKIFLCRISDSNKTHADRLDVDLRLQLTQICAPWRSIAFAESALWNLTIFPPDCYIELIAGWFRQCRTKIGLGVVVMMPGYKFSYPYPDLQPVILTEAVLPFSRKLWTVGLYVTKSSLESIVSQPFQSLEELSLDLGSADYDHWNASDLEFKMPIPALRSVCLNVNDGFDDERFLLGLPLAQLTDLNLIGWIVATDFVQVLEQCTALESCAVHALRQTRYKNNPLEPRPLPRTAIRLPHLRRLEIGIVTSVEDLLYSLEAPNLKWLLTDASFSPHEQHGFPGWLRHLRHADLVSKKAEAPIDEGLLSAISSAEEVILKRYILQPSTLNRIGSGDLLPKMVELHIYQKDFESIADMLNTRSTNAEAHPGHISQIKTIKIYCKGRLEEVGAIFYSCSSRGVNVQLLPW